MKKIIFAFIATIMLTGSSFSQSTANKAIMVMVVEGAKAHYKKGTDLQSLLNESGATAAPEIAFITKLHQFLESGKSGNDIFSTYDGKEINDLKNYKKTGKTLFAGSTSGKNIFGWIRSFLTFLQDVFDSCCENLEICC